MRSPSSASTRASAARAATRRRRARRSGSSRSATHSANGTRSNQRPELWNLYNARVHAGEHVRVFPISNWTELDVWQYIERERLDVPSIYFAHPRRVVRRRSALVPVTELTPPRDGERVETLSVRFRTVGDITCTAPVASSGATVDAIIAETRCHDDHRARRDAPRRPDQRRVDGAAQAARDTSDGSPRSDRPDATTACCGS